MIFRVLGTILLGGGALGALSGWLLIRWLEGKRKAGLAHAKHVAEVVAATGKPPGWERSGLFSGLARMQRELVRPPTQPPPKPPGLGHPAAPWPVLPPEQPQMWTPTADPNAPKAQPPAPEDPLVTLMRKRREMKMQQALHQLEEYLRDNPPEGKK